MYSDDEIRDFFDNDDFDDEPVLGDDEAIEVADKDELERALGDKKEGKAPRKRIVQNPQPKLNEVTLTGENGLKALVDIFKTYKPDKKQDPYYNLDICMKRYENWSHVLFPRLKFDDIIARCEKLGSKSRVKMYLNKIRYGDPLDEEEDGRESNKNNLISTDNNEEKAPVEDDDWIPKKKQKKGSSQKFTNDAIGVITSRDSDDEETPARPIQKENIPHDDFDEFHVEDPDEDARRQFEQEADAMMDDFDY